MPFPDTTRNWDFRHGNVRTKVHDNRKGVKRNGFPLVLSLTLYVECVFVRGGIFRWGSKVEYTRD